MYEGKLQLEINIMYSICTLHNNKYRLSDLFDVFDLSW